MESNIIDELLNRVKSLEDKNLLLKQNVSKIKEELNEITRKGSIDSKANLEDGKYFLT